MSKTLSLKSKIIKNLKRKTPLSVKELAAKVSTTQKEVREVLKELRQDDTNLVVKKGKYLITKEPKYVDLGQKYSITSDEDHKFKFGVCTDQHLCSKYERLDVLDTIYDIFEIEGIETVFNCGNYIDGFIPRINGHDVVEHTLSGQTDYLIENYPQREGITNYVVSGDDHEGWFAKDMGLDVGAYVERKMLEAGRTDWKNIGYMEADVPLVNAKSGKRGIVRVQHPGGGTAYAISYQPQKIVESLSGGEKPDIILLGHYHKSAYFRVRGVRVILAGCVQDQSPFMRKKRLAAHIGGWIVEARQNPKTGQIVSMKTEELAFSVKNSPNNRWNYESRVSKAKMQVE